MRRFRIFVTWKPDVSDYIGADNAGLHALLLQRPGSDGEGKQKGSALDLRGRNLGVVKDLYGVTAWVEKRNATRTHEE
jgi:hypothetical protein